MVSSHDSKTHHVAIIVALIGLVGVLGTALISQWDRIFPQGAPDPIPIAADHTTVDDRPASDTRVQAAPTVLSFVAMPAVVEPGESVTLRWMVKAPATVSIDPGIGAVSESGQYTLTPAANTTFTILAVGPDGQTTTDTTSIRVLEELPDIEVDVSVPATLYSIPLSPTTIESPNRTDTRYHGKIDLHEIGNELNVTVVVSVTAINQQTNQQWLTHEGTKTFSWRFTGAQDLRLLESFDCNGFARTVSGGDAPFGTTSYGVQRCGGTPGYTFLDTYRFDGQTMRIRLRSLSTRATYAPGVTRKDPELR